MASCPDRMTARGATIWLLTEDYPPKLGGISRWSANTAGALEAAGASVTVLSKRAAARSGAEGPEIVPVEGRSFCALRHLHFMRAARRLRRLRGGWPDAILCSTWRTAEGALLARAECPVASAVHGLEVFASYTPWLRARRRKVLERVDLAAAASRYTAARLSETAPAARVLVGINGFDGNLFRPDGPMRPRNRPVQLLSAGRLVPRKRFDLVLDAFAEVLRSGVDAGLWIAGEGPLEGSVKGRIADFDGRAEYLGDVSDGELAALYRSADLFLSPCQSDPASGDVEGFGLTFVEASASGTAVAGLAEGGVTDAVEHGVSGILSTRESFVRDVADLCSRPEMLARLGRQGMDRARAAFDSCSVAARLLAALLEARR